jgi:hypothetical protein
MTRHCLATLVAWLAAAPAPGADLPKVDRTIGKEPVYRTKAAPVRPVRVRAGRQGPRPAGAGRRKAPPRTLVARHGFVGGVAFSPDGRTLAFGSSGGVHLFDLTT